MKIVIAILLAAALSAGTEKTEPVKKMNRVSFGQVAPGEDLKLFLDVNKEYKASKGVNWLEFAKPDDKTTIWATAPDDVSISKKVLGRMPVISVTGPGSKCETTSTLLFLEGPAKQSGSNLFLYEYNVCDNTGLVTPQTMMDQYIAKYGMYDKKDYDRNMIIYKNVREHFRVAVRPFTPGEGPGGITITVVDDDVFRQKYFGWRASLKKATEVVRKLF